MSKTRKESVVINADNFDSVIARLKRNDPKLRDITLETCWTIKPYQAIPQKKVQQFLTAVSRNKTLKILKIGSIDCKEGNWLGKAIGDMLKKNDSLAVLEVECCDLSLPSMQALCEGLADNTFLKRLSMVYNTICPKGAALLGKALEKNRALQELYISGNDLGNDGAKALAASLKKNTTLLSLALPENDVLEEGFIAILDMLVANQTIEHADFSSISRNAIAPKGTDELIPGINTEFSDLVIDKLCQVIRQNSTLAELRMPYSRVDVGYDTLGFRGGNPNMTTDDRPERLAAALAKNRSLNLLDIELCGIRKAEGSVLIQGLGRNKRLARIHVGHYPGLDFSQNPAFVPAMLAFAKSNPNFLGLDRGRQYRPTSELKSALQRNRNKADDLIEKIVSPNTALQKEDVAQIRQVLPAIIRVLYQEGLENVRTVIAKAVTKAKKAGFQLWVPGYYLPLFGDIDRNTHSLESDKEDCDAFKKPGMKKIDFSSVAQRVGEHSGDTSAQEVFAKVSARRKYPVPYQATAMGQFKELKECMDRTGGVFTVEDLMYRPSDKDPRLIDMIVEQQLLPEVMTVKNWTHNPQGLDAMLSEIEPWKIENQLGSENAIAGLRTQLVTAKVKRGRKGITIG